MRMRRTVLIAADHPAFAGHFPDFPVLPGALLLDEILNAVASARGIDLEKWRVSSAKFLGAVRPNDSLVLEHEATAAGAIQFSACVEDRKVASGTLHEC